MNFRQRVRDLQAALESRGGNLDAIALDKGVSLYLTGFLQPLDPSFLQSIADSSQAARTRATRKDLSLRSAASGTLV